MSIICIYSYTLHKFYKIKWTGEKSYILPLDSFTVNMYITSYTKAAIVELVKGMGSLSMSYVGYSYMTGQKSVEKRFGSSDKRIAEDNMSINT